MLLNCKRHRDTEREWIHSPFPHSCLTQPLLRLPPPDFMSPPHDPCTLRGQYMWPCLAVLGSPASDLAQLQDLLHVRPSPQRGPRPLFQLFLIGHGWKSQAGLIRLLCVQNTLSAKEISLTGSAMWALGGRILIDDIVQGTAGIYWGAA